MNLNNPLLNSSDFFDPALVVTRSSDTPQSSPRTLTPPPPGTSLIRQVMHRLQKAGVAAAAVQTGEDVDYDPHLRARGFIVPVDDPESGPMEVGGLTCHLSRTPGRASMSGRPELGGANDYVLDTLLGLSNEERQHLVEIEAVA